jgi:competence protein ComEC
VESETERLEVTSVSVIPVLGDIVTIEGKAKPLSAEYERTYLARGVTGVVTASAASVAIVQHVTGPMAWGTTWRESFLDFTGRKLSGEDNAVVAALAFDVRTGLTLPARDALEQSGTVHVLAASGLHLLTLVWFLELLLSRLPLPYFVRRTIILMLSGLFSIAGGIHPGTFRAWVSTALRDGSVISGRPYDALSALGVAGVAYLTWRPSAVYDAGFQLSMILGAGIALFRTQTSGTPFLPRVLKGAVSVWLVSLPIVANLFGIVSLVSIPANLLAGLLLPVCFLGLLAGHAASFFSDGLSQVILVPAVFAAHGLESIVYGFGHFRGWGFRVPPFNAYWLVPIYGLALILWKPKERPIS